MAAAAEATGEARIPSPPPPPPPRRHALFGRGTIRHHHLCAASLVRRGANHTCAASRSVWSYVCTCGAFIASYWTALMPAIRRSGAKPPPRQILASGSRVS